MTLNLLVPVRAAQRLREGGAPHGEEGSPLYDEESAGGVKFEYGRRARGIAGNGRIPWGGSARGRTGREKQGGMERGPTPAGQASASCANSKKTSISFRFSNFFSLK